MRILPRSLLLPPTISAFEAAYLARVNRSALWVFAAHLPVFVLLAWVNRTGPLLAFGLTAGVLLGPVVAHQTLRSPRAVSLVHGMTAMFLGGLLVHFGQGPMQIEMHFYFFAALAMLAVFANPLVIVVATATVALHHLALWFVLPRSVFNYAAPLWVVAVHAVFVILEAGAVGFGARRFFDNFIGIARINDLERLTAELDGRNRDLHIVLDHVEQGLVTIDRAGRVAPEHARALDRWFGVPALGTTLFDYVATFARDFAADSRVAWEQVVDGFLPLELALAQMPHALAVAGREFRVAYQPIGHGDAPERFLVVVTDVTAATQRARVEQEQRESIQVFERLLQDRIAFLAFFDEASAIVAALGPDVAHADCVTLKRALHTLKGNAALFGLESVATLSHRLESLLVDDARMPRAHELAPLQARWGRLAAQLEQLGTSRLRGIAIDDVQFDTLERAVRRRAPAEVVLRLVHDLRLEPTRVRLEQFAEQARRIAHRLGKPEPRVVLEHHTIRLDPHAWAPFWSVFIHVIRNAIDHGVEPADARVACGKPAYGTLCLSTSIERGELVFTVADDGRGVDWDGVAARAHALGLPAASRDDLEQALFADGLSTARDVSEISGRGMGLSAMRATVASRGGRLEVVSDAGCGTTLRMVFPAEAAAPAMYAADRPASAVTMQTGPS